MADTFNGFRKWQCRVGKVTQFVILTWAPTELAARTQVAAFEDVPLHWVTAQQMGTV